MARNLSHKPVVPDPILQKWVNQVHDFINNQPPIAIGAPGSPHSLSVNPGPGMNVITFVAGQGATSHLILVSPSSGWDPTKPGNHIIDIGASTSYSHVVGTAGTRWNYWVVGVRNGMRTNPPVGPVSGTTLGLATPLTPIAISRQAPGNVVNSELTQSPTINLPGLTRGGRQL